MKKVAAIILTIAMILSMCACGNSQAEKMEALEGVWGATWTTDSSTGMGRYEFFWFEEEKVCIISGILLDDYIVSMSAWGPYDYKIGSEKITWDGTSSYAFDGISYTYEDGEMLFTGSGSIWPDGINKYSEMPSVILESIDFDKDGNIYVIDE